jgi:flagellar biosynthesis chaperone FliJ
MHKINELKKAQDLLSRAIVIASSTMPNSRYIQEAKIHVRKAISELDEAIGKQSQKRVDQDKQSNQWWSKIIAGVANQSMNKEACMTKEAYNRSLSQLNGMIDEEQKKLQELEKNSQKSDAIDEILND